MLDLSRINEQSFKIIERCTQLQELYAGNIRTTLRLGKWLLMKDAVFPRLKRYKLNIGEIDGYHMYGDDDKFSADYHSKSLSLGELKISASSPFIKDLLRQTVFVLLDRCNGGCKNIVPDIVQVVGGMNELTTLCLRSCSDLECLADAASHEAETWLFPELINLKLESLANLKLIWCGPPLLCFFEKLEELHIIKCHMLTSLFPKCVSGAMLSLQKLYIKGCSELKNIIEEDGDGANNEIISASNNNAYLVFSKLKSLTIIDCDKLEYVFSNSCVQGLEQLEKVDIDGASQLKYAFGQHEDEQEVQIKLPILKSLKLKGLKNLLSIFPKSIHSSCPLLKELHCVDCPKFKDSCVNITVGSNINMDYPLNSRVSARLSFLNLEKLKVESCSTEDILFALDRDVFIDRNFQNNLISSLNALELKNLSELKFVWSGPMEKYSLQNLKKFSASGCNNLKTILSPGILKRMPLLEVLEISDCNELEEIMSSTEIGEHHQDPLNAPQSPQICFPNLKRLQVQRCNKLKCLISMAIDWNDFLKNVLPNLRSLTLNQVPSLKDFCHGLPLSNDCLLQLLGSKLEELRLGELWLIWRAPSYISNLVHLRTLALCHCNKLKSVLGEGTHRRSLPVLEDLIICTCEELEVITAQDHEFQTCFPTLRYLWVKHCNKLKSLFSITSSVTILLPHLYEIDISECAELEQLFERRIEGNSRSDNVNEIMLPNLLYVWLSKLPSLVDVCKGFKFSAEKLQNIKKENCPKFSSIMGATGSMWIEIFRQKEEPHANNGNQPLHQLPYFYPERLRLAELEFQNLSELSFICTAFASSQILSFQYLEYLSVHGCGKLKWIFSMSVWGSLPQLSGLEITECEEVEEIMQDSLEEAQNVSNSNYMQLPFPKLYWITVKGCNKLKCLLRNVVVGMLPKLASIEVSGASQMEELFSHKSDEATASTQELVLPNLYTLQLLEMPSLAHFCKGFKLNAPQLKKVQIDECPKYDFSSRQQAASAKTTDV